MDSVSLPVTRRTSPSYLLSRTEKSVGKLSQYLKQSLQPWQISNVRSISLWRASGFQYFSSAGSYEIPSDGLYAMFLSAVSTSCQISTRDAAFCSSRVTKETLRFDGEKTGIAAESTLSSVSPWSIQLSGVLP